MADEPLFRTAISGFNKDDVNVYIEGLNRAAAENQDWFDRQSKAMADTIKRLTRENNRLKAEGGNPEAVDALQKQLAEKTEECEQLRRQLEQAQQELKNAPLSSNEQIRERVQEVLREREDMKAKIARYEEELSRLRQSAPETPAEVGSEQADRLAAAEREAQQAKSVLLQARQKLIQMQSQNDALRRQLEQTQEQAARQIDELSLQNRQLRDKEQEKPAIPSFSADLRLREAQDRVTSLEQEVARMRNENEYLRANVTDPEELRSMYDKSRLYDDIKNNVGRIITEARKRAADTVSQAEEQKAQILRQGMEGLSQMQKRIEAMKKEIDVAQKMYADTSISMSGMFNSINDSVNITENQLISILGPQMDPPAAPAAPSPSRPAERRKTGNEDIWPL